MKSIASYLGKISFLIFYIQVKVYEEYSFLFGGKNAF